MTTRSTPWPPGRPCWVDMSVVDLRAAQRFYGAVLGWSFVDTGQKLGHYTRCTVADLDAAALFRPVPGTDALPWTTYLASADVTETAGLVEQHGGRVVSEPLSIPGIGIMALATDPRGALLGIWQSTGMIGFGVVDEPGAVAWTELRTDDVEGSAAFYGAVFGLSLRDADGPHGSHVLLEDGEPVGSVHSLDEEHPTPGWWVHFAVRDLDAALERATAAGGRLRSPVRATPRGRVAELDDPSAVPFALVERAD